MSEQEELVELQRDVADAQRALEDRQHQIRKGWPRDGERKPSTTFNEQLDSGIGQANGKKNLLPERTEPAGPGASPSKSTTKATGTSAAKTSTKNA